MALSISEEQTQFIRSPSSSTESSLTLDMKEFSAYWGIEVSFTRPAPKSITLSRPFTLRVSGVTASAAMTCAEAQLWFNGFALAYAAAHHTVATKLEVALRRG